MFYSPRKTTGRCASDTPMPVFWDFDTFPSRSPACQTSDVSTEHAEMRKIVLGAHIGLISFQRIDLGFAINVRPLDRRD